MNKTNYIILKEKSLNFNPLNLADILGFEDGLRLAYDMLFNEEWDESLQEYATSVLEELRRKYPDEWNSSWKYDAFLGYAYDIILKYDERYTAYKRAFDKTQPSPPQLLVALATCCIAPGKPPITEEEAIVLVKQAIKTNLYIEAVDFLRGLYKSIGNSEEELYWDKILERIKDNGDHLPSLELEF